MSQKIIVAIHEVMKKVGYVQKKGRNEFHKYNYAGESELLEALRPELLEQGLVLIPSGQSISEIDANGNTHVAIDYTLAHTSGEVWPEKIRAFGCGNDRSSKGTVGDKGTYKALTGANKYLLFKLFQIETGDDPEKDNDPGNTSAAKEKPVKSDGKFISANKASILKNKAEKVKLAGDELIQVLQLYGVDSLETVTEDKYSVIKKALEDSDVPF